MSKFNPDFWEVTLSRESWQQFTIEDAVGYEPPGEAELRHEREVRAKARWPELRAIAEKVLTPRQREILLLYFFEGLNQRQVAEQMKISQQSVSEHLYGKIRDGHAVGGALRKIRKACARQGIRQDLTEARASIDH